MSKTQPVLPDDFKDKKRLARSFYKSLGKIVSPDFAEENGLALSHYLIPRLTTSPENVVSNDLSATNIPKATRIPLATIIPLNVTLLYDQILSIERTIAELVAVNKNMLPRNEALEILFNDLEKIKGYKDIKTKVHIGCAAHLLDVARQTGKNNPDATLTSIELALGHIRDSGGFEVTSKHPHCRIVPEEILGILKEITKPAIKKSAIIDLLTKMTPSLPSRPDPSVTHQSSLIAAYGD